MEIHPSRIRPREHTEFEAGENREGEAYSSSCREASRQMIGRIGFICLLLVGSAFAAEAASETWQCKLLSEGAARPEEMSFEINGSKLFRSADDLTGRRLELKITEKTDGLIRAVYKNDQRKIEVRIDRRTGNAAMTGGNLQWTGWLDRWTGPCVKR